MQPSLPSLTFPAIRRGSTWLRPIPDQPGLYASSHGKIWSNRGRGKQVGWKKLKFRRGGFKKGDEARGGYYVLHFRDYTKPPPKPRKAVSVHILVASAWIGPRPEGFHVDHKDENHLNNRPDNLQYVPAHVNNAYRHGLDRDEDWEAVL